MTKKIAFVFPGQGSQSIGMLQELSQEFEQIKATFAEASAILAYDLWQIAQQGPQEKIDQTAITQPLMLAADIAVYRCWQQQTSHKPEVVAGHSLGEYAALVAAGVISFADAVALVAKRGQYMQAAVPAGVGAMAAIIGLEDQQIEQLCEEARQGDVLSPANFNSIGQTVIAGHAVAVDRAILLAKNLKAKIAKRIPVSVPSHCALMQSAADKLQADLSRIEIKPPQLTVLHNADTQSHQAPNAMLHALTQQLTSPVRWVETIQTIIRHYSINTFIECGAGKVLAGLIKRIDRNATVFSIGLSAQQLQAAIDNVNELS